MLNSLTVIIGKVHSRQQVSQCQSADFAPLLKDFHQLQQGILTIISQGKIPAAKGQSGVIGVTGYTGATGPSGAAGIIGATGQPPGTVIYPARLIIS